MAKETTYEEIARELKNRIYKPVYYLMGEESYYIDRISEYIAQTVLNENEKEFNQTIVYGADTDIATVINAAKRYPMTVSYTHLDVYKRQVLVAGRTYGSCDPRGSRSGSTENVACVW